MYICIFDYKYVYFRHTFEMLTNRITRTYNTYVYKDRQTDRHIQTGFVEGIYFILFICISLFICNLKALKQTIFTIYLFFINKFCYAVCMYVCIREELLRDY